MAGLYPAGVICEMMSEDGTMARAKEIEGFSERHDIGVVTVADIITFRRGHEKLIERVAEARLPTRYGEFTAVSYRSIVDNNEHVALVKGEISPEEPALVRVHSECLTGDVFGSIRCDCGEQASLALKAIADNGKGIFLYMRQEGRGIGIHNKIKAYQLQDRGLDTVDANAYLGFAPDLRHYGVGAQILSDLGLGKMRLLTNNPKKVVGLESFGIHTIERVPIIGSVNDENSRYLNTKREKMGHILEETVDDLELQK
jgi:3,4-dihydroxy 2-butanone 4-phosphate synthase/GTP cyclohydrolase II